MRAQRAGVSRLRRSLAPAGEDGEIRAGDGSPHSGHSVNFLPLYVAYPRAPVLTNPTVRCIVRVSHVGRCEVRIRARKSVPSMGRIGTWATLSSGASIDRLSFVPRRASASNLPSEELVRVVDEFRAT